MYEDAYFKRKKVNIQKLIAFGFAPKDDAFEYEQGILNGQFKLKVIADKAGYVRARVYDSEPGDEYTLYKADGAVGAFVGRVRSDAESALIEISEKCFDMDVFKTKQARLIIEYARKTYGDELEYLWAKFPDNAIWRRKDNKKWYGAILTVSRRKLGLDSDEVVEIIDFRLEKGEIDSVIDQKRYFPGWHMNKKSWCTVILDGSVDIQEIYNHIDKSYQLAGNK